MRVRAADLVELWYFFFFFFFFFCSFSCTTNRSVAPHRTAHQSLVVPVCFCQFSAVLFSCSLLLFFALIARLLLFSLAVHFIDLLHLLLLLLLGLCCSISSSPLLYYFAFPTFLVYLRLLLLLLLLLLLVGLAVARNFAFAAICMPSSISESFLSAAAAAAFLLACLLFFHCSDFQKPI